MPRWTPRCLGFAAMGTIAVLGAGKIGEALLSGLISAGKSAEELLFTERHPDVRPS